MKTTPLLILLSSLLCATGWSDGILERIEKDPGGFDQMCSESSIPQGVPIPLFRRVERQMIFVSSKNMDELRAHRDEVVPELVKKLETVDMDKPGTSFNAIYYQIIPGVDAVAALPQVLRIEEQVKNAISKLDKNPKQGTKEGENLLKLEIEQRELLSVVLQLLRGQRFQPLLDSDFGKIYAAVIKARANEKDLRDIKTPADAKAKGDEWLAFDPIYHVPLGYMNEPPSVPYSDETRGQIRGLAEQFLKTVAPDKWVVNAH